MVVRDSGMEVVAVGPSPHMDRCHSIQGLDKILDNPSTQNSRCRTGKIVEDSGTVVADGTSLQQALKP